jgi:uncharacterized protein (TIGR03083 family)
MDPTPAPTTVPALLHRIEAARQELDNLIHPLSEAQWTAPGLDGGWAVKDVLAHLTFWEGRMMGQIEAGRIGVPWPDPFPRRPDEAGEPRMHRLNEANYAAHRADPLAAVRAAAAHAYEQLVAWVGTLADADLAPGSPLAQAVGSPIVDWIAGDTYEHYEEHAAQMRAWLAGGTA